MIIFIYNIIVIIFSLVLITSGQINAAYAMYTIFGFGALWVAYSLKSAVEEYPNLSLNVKNGAEIIYLTEFQTKIGNYIGSGLIHAGIALFLLHSVVVTIGILIVAAARIKFAFDVNKKIKASS